MSKFAIHNLLQNWFKKSAKHKNSMEGLYSLSLLKKSKSNHLYNIIQSNVDQGNTIYVFFFDIVNFSSFEEEYGSSVCKNILKAFKNIVTETALQKLPSKNFLGSISFGGDDFAVYVSSVSLNHNPEKIYEIGFSIKKALDIKLNNIFSTVINREIKTHIGYSMIAPGSPYSLESQIYHSAKEALSMAKTGIEPKIAKLKIELQEIISQKMISTVYQPIVSLSSGQVYGFEALTRGPENSFFYSPVNLFSFATKEKLVYQLDRIARESAVKSFPNGSDKKLFLNIDPQIVNSGSFSAGFTKKLASDYNIKPHNIVFELTEREHIKDFSVFIKALEHYRSQGYLIAIDDAGAGYSSLQSIAELKPDYIKIDMSLTRDIHKNSIKQSLLETFMTLSQKINSTLIAEGIENEDELNELIKIGIPYGQGYYLVRPDASPKSPKETICEKIRDSHRKYFNFNSNEVKIGSLSENALTVGPNCLTQSIINYFETIENVDTVVVLDNYHPIGIITKDNLYQKLSQQYGNSLYPKRKVSMIMCKHPLVIEENVTIENCLKLVAGRATRRLNQDIIITREGKFAGIVPVKKLLEKISEIRQENALFANSLTGLPGNIIIERELKTRIAREEEFAFIFVDLDHFKEYNDKYGFEKGDMIIKMTAHILTEAVERVGSKYDFIGHIGGDDFVLITSIDSVDDICKNIIASFDKGILSYYTHEDINNGYIVSSDRQGNITKIPIMSISIAVVENKNNFNSHLEISEKAAELKKYAKSRSKSVYVKDRRHN